MKGKLLLAAASLFVSLGLGLGLCEIYYRATQDPIDLAVYTGRKAGTFRAHQYKVDDAFAAFRVRPHATLKREDKTANSFGFVSTPELPVKKPEGTVRIAFLGGSSTMNSRLSDEQTWVWQTVERLRRSFPDARIDFINGGVNAATSFESYGRLWARIRFFEPDIVVLYHGWNELYYFDRPPEEMVSWRVLADGGWTIDWLDRPVEFYEPWRLDPLLGVSQALTRWRLALSEPVSEEGGVEREHLADHFDYGALDVWRTNLRLLRDTAEILGASFFVAKQATLMVPDLPKKLRRRIRVWLHGFDYATHLEAFDALYGVIDEEIEPSRVIDVTSLNGNPEYFRDHVHLTEEGAGAVADVMAESLGRWFEDRGYRHEAGAADAGPPARMQD